MSRPLKDYTPICVKMDNKAHDKLLEFCKETGMSKTATIEKAVEKYIDNYNRIKDL